MNPIMKKAQRLAVLTLVLCSVSSAQTPKVHKVAVIVEGPDSESVVAAVKAKVGGTLRYQLAEAENSDLWVDIQCLKVTQENRVVGLSCSAMFTYLPESLPGSDVYLTTTLHTGSFSGEGIAQGIFEGFVTATSEIELETKKSQAIHHIYFACRDRSNKDDQVAKACKGEKPL